MKEERDDYGLRPLWDAILPIYAEFRRVCVRYGLRHWAAFGTALGAARHGGFIPWDDDFDVMMPRADYEKFLQVAELELPRHMRAITWQNTDGYKWLFGKVQDVRADNLVRVEAMLGRTLPQGIYIDIFPCDGYPDGWLARQFQKLCGLSLCAKREFRTCPAELRNRIRRRIMIELGRFSPFYSQARTLRDFVAANDARMKSIPFGATKQAIVCGVRASLGLGGITFPSDLFADSVELPFEEVTIPVVGDYSRYLTVAFGEWRKLPPENCRGLTHRNEAVAPWRCA